MAKEITRQGKQFVGFVVLNSNKLQKAIALFKTQKLEDDSYLESFKVEFKYTPIYLKGEAVDWPAHIEKKWRFGYNPAHADLFYEIPVERNKPNTIHNIFAKILCKQKNEFCEVYEDPSGNDDSLEWKGSKLC